MDKRPVTLKQIAIASGISVSAVSRILNNDVRRFSQATVERVHKISGKLGYSKNFDAYRLAKGRSRDKDLSIGCIAAAGYDLAVDPFISEILKGIRKEANNSGIRLAYCISLNSVNLEEEVEKALDIPICGIIFVEIAEDSIINKFGHITKNVVFTGVSYKNLLGNLVFTDIEAAAREAVDKLIRVGHKKIAFIGKLCQATESGYEYRYKGYLDALKHNGINRDDRLIQPIGWGLEEGKRGAEALLKKGADFTAVFCSGDDIALGASKVFRKNGVSIPEDLSILGFDNSSLVRKISPNLSSIHIYKHELGEIAVKLLKENLRSGYEFHSKFEIPWKIIMRGSVRAL